MPADVYTVAFINGTKKWSSTHQLLVKAPRRTATARLALRELAAEARAAAAAARAAAVGARERAEAARVPVATARALAAVARAAAAVALEGRP
jgi:hypothetical protein